MWTTYGKSSARTKPKARRWISTPILVAIGPVALLVLLMVLSSPLTLPLALIPLALAFQVFVWLDRVEPEPGASRIHALLWGASVAVLISIVVNTSVAALFGEAVSAVLSAPIIEEATKALILVACVRRGEIDRPMDGIVYAGWSALGFAAVENMLYMSETSSPAELLGVFIVRGILTPFAHPLFTMWIGLLVGIAAQQGRNKLGYGLVGYVIAVSLHMAWNGSLVLGAMWGSALLIAVSGVAFIALFTVTATALLLRRREVARLTALVQT